MNTNASMQTSVNEPDERAVWRGSPSQIVNLPLFVLWLGVFGVIVTVGVLLWNAMVANLPPAFLWLLCAAALIPLVVIAWKWAVIANTVYELTTQRLRTRWGVFNKHLDELELYRVRDYRLQQPFFLRIFSLSNVVLQTSDRSHATFVLRAIANGEDVREQMRTYVEDARRRRGVRELDIE